MDPQTAAMVSALYGNQGGGPAAPQGPMPVQGGQPPQNPVEGATAGTVGDATTVGGEAQQNLQTSDLNAALGDTGNLTQSSSLGIGGPMNMYPPGYNFLNPPPGILSTGA